VFVWIDKTLLERKQHMSDIVKTLSKLVADLSPEMKQKIYELLKPEPEPIAVIGVGCRLPGKINNTEQYWEALKEGVDAITEIPKDRWEVDEYYDSDPNAVNKINTRWGGFIEQVSKFDYGFFNLSPREASYIDPQERLLLEVAWEAVEDAGQIISDHSGNKTGVFVGIYNNDYLLLQANGTRIDNYTGLSAYHGLAANRISYIWDLHGPSIAIDTACSSSLVAVHLACNSLRNKETDMALAGGVSLIISPISSIIVAKSLGQASDGRCKTFDARADGFVRGEGCGIVVLKRLSDALANKDNILALIRGSAVNQDGRSASFTSPNPLAQESVLKAALASAKLSPQEVSYIEAHGTGTALGDPIEMGALTHVYGKKINIEEQCTIGSVKTNIGHLEAAAGIAGLIKVVLCLKNKALVPHINFRELNPSIHLESTRFNIATEHKVWETKAKTRYAAISSFGVGGTNAHIILQEASTKDLSKTNTQHSQNTTQETTLYYLLCLSATSKDALRDRAKDFTKYLNETQEELSNICYTANARRSHNEYRLAVVGKTKKEIEQKLINYLTGDLSEISSNKVGTTTKLAFSFPGQGSQELGMGINLFEKEPVFRETLQKCNDILRKNHNFDLLQEILAKESYRFSQTEIAQPVLCAFQISLAALWASWGVVPNAVIGHSLGEIAAAHIAEVFTLEETLSIAYHRGRIMQKATGYGKMVAIFAPLPIVEKMVEGYKEHISIAANNSPRQVIVSGQETFLEEVLSIVKEQGYLYQFLKVNYAFHSPQMEPFKVELIAALKNIKPQKASIPIFSTVTGEVSDGRNLTAEYWGRHIRETVKFCEAVTTMIADGYYSFLEISPHPPLSGAINDCFPDNLKGNVIASLYRKQDDQLTLLTALGKLYSIGFPINWKKLYLYGGQLVSLPAYPWQREYLWINTQNRIREQISGQNNLIGKCFTPASEENKYFWEFELSIVNFPYLADHIVRDRVVVPGAFWMSLALAAVKEIFGNISCQLEDIHFYQMLFLPNEQSKKTQLIINKENDLISFQIFSIKNNNWLLLSEGKIRPNSIAEINRGILDVESEKLKFQDQITKANFYKQMSQNGIQLGESFQVISQVYYQLGEAFSELSLPKTILADAHNYKIHPAMLDSCFQTLTATLSQVEEDLEEIPTYIPVSIKEYKIYKEIGSRAWCQAKFRDMDATKDSLHADISLFDNQGNKLLEIIDLQVQAIDKQTLVTDGDWYYEIAWRQVLQDVSLNTEEQRNWLVFAKENNLSKEIVKRLTGNIMQVLPSTEYKLEENLCYVNLDKLEDFQQMYQQVKEFQPTHILYLWGLSENTLINSQTLQADYNLGSIGLLNAVQTILQANWENLPKLSVITNGTQAFSNENLALGQTPIWGITRCIALEHSELNCQTIDLSYKTNEEEIELLIKTLYFDDKETLRLIRDNQSYVARLAPIKIADVSNSTIFSTEHSYLVVGIGGIGIEVVNWLAQNKVKYLILLTRSELTNEAKNLVSSLNNLSVSIKVIKADIADYERLKEAFLEIEREMPPIKGIFQTAGVLDDGLILQQTPEKFKQVIKPKILGTWNLHLLSLAMDLDFFVLFSSAASTLGSRGQSNYSAANSFLDALAHYRRSLGKAAVSINWGPWEKVGMAARLKDVGKNGLTGVKNISPEQALAALKHIMEQDIRQIGVFSINFRQWQRFYPKWAKLSIFDELNKQTFNNVVENDLRDVLALQSNLAKRQTLEDHISKQIAQILHLPEERLDINRSFQELGVDSLMALEIRSRLENSLAIILPATLIWLCPNINSLVPYVAQKMGVDLENEPIEKAQETISSIDQVKEMSEIEAEASLLEELNKLGL
jgi:myxalamid-type polyketide synthase MxaE and MxaD